MSKESLVRFIQNHIAIPTETVRAIAEHFDEKTIAQHQFFLKEGATSNEYLFLETGFMRAFTLDTNGNEVTTNFYAANQVVFEVASFFNRTYSKENIEALSDCKGYVLNFEQLNTLFHTVPEFREFGRAMLVKGFVALKQRTLSLINETAEERYLSLVRYQPGIVQQAPLKYIASYLGITDTSLSRIRRAAAKK